MTVREAAIVTAFTGTLIGKFSDAHKYIEEVMGRPVDPGEMKDKRFWEELSDKTLHAFLDIEVKP